jgi:integrase
VPPLAEIVSFPQPPKEFLDSLNNVSDNLAFFLYHGRKPGTRRNYKSYTKSWEMFCKLRSIPPYPAQEQWLAEWIAGRGEGTTEPSQGRLKAETCRSALSAIRAYHVERLLPTTAFNSEYIDLVIQGITYTQGSESKKKAEPISLAQLEEITEEAPITSPATRELYSDVPPTAKEVDQVNFDTAFKIAFAGFLRTKEVTYDEVELSNKNSFKHTHLLRRDVHFADGDEHAIISLRGSKCDFKATGVEIVLAATGTPTCPVSGLRALFETDPQPADAPLFRTAAGAFTRERYVNTLRNRLRAAGCYNSREYAGHSFRRGAAQHAVDNGILNEDIQRLGRWSSQAFLGYYSISHQYKYTLNRRFLTGRSPPIINSSLNVI